jgi:hypothetical protein
MSDSPGLTDTGGEPSTPAGGGPRSTNEKEPRRAFDQYFIDGAVKLVTQSGYSLAAAAKAVDVPLYDSSSMVPKHRRKAIYTVLRAYSGLKGFFSAQGLLAGRFKVRADFYPNSLKEPLPMSRFACPKTGRIWAELIAKCERSNTPTPQFCQSIGCSPTSFHPWEGKLAAKLQTSAFLRGLAHQGLHRDQTPRSRREA